jgi:host factor-I protein
MGKSMSMNLQDVFLNQLRRDKVLITLYLVNGFQIKGIIKGFDNFVIVLEVDGNQQIIYKHAISTILPMKPINLIFQDQVHDL